MKYHLTPLRMTIIKKNNKRWWGCAENSHALLVGMFTGAATMENSMEDSQKLKIELPHDPAIPLLGVYLKKNKNTNLKRNMDSKVPSSNFQHMKQPVCPSMMNG